MTQTLLNELKALREAHECAATRADFDELWNKVQWIEALSAMVRRDHAEEQAIIALKAAVSEAIHAHREGLSQSADFSVKVTTMEQMVTRRTVGEDGRPLVSP